MNWKCKMGIHKYEFKFGVRTYFGIENLFICKKCGHMSSPTWLERQKWKI